MTRDNLSTPTVGNLEKKLAAIDQRIQDLTAQRVELENQWLIETKKKTASFVGKSYRSGEKYARIISMPHWKKLIANLWCNGNQFPAVILTAELIPFRLGTIPVDSIHKYWSEISAEDFDTEFEKRLSWLRELLAGEIPHEKLEKTGQIFWPVEKESKSPHI